MEINLYLHTSLALRGVNPQNLRPSRGRRRSDLDSHYTPMQISARHNFKPSFATEDRARATHSQNRAQKGDLRLRIRNHREHFAIGKTDRGAQDGQVHKQAQIEEPAAQKKQKPEGRKDLVSTTLGVGKISQRRAKRCMCGDCQDCFKDFAYFLHTFSTDQSVPEITAKSWCIWRRNQRNNKFAHYYGKRIHKVREIASLTKIITSMAVMDFLNKGGYDPHRVTYEIRKPSLMVGGTSACLQLGEVYTIHELLYGMMLPSGNDAAVALSEVIGLMHILTIRNKLFDPYKQNWYSQFLSDPSKSYSYHFILLMNEKCQKLGLLDTHMYNSHGNDAYDQLKNVSTCNEIAKTSAQYMLKYQSLRAIVQSKIYHVPRHAKTWYNTNKLLEDGFEGIKTGITETAGPCLSACYKDLIVVVLSSKSMNERWIEVKKLVRWIIRKGI